MLVSRTNIAISQVVVIKVNAFSSVFLSHEAKMAKKALSPPIGIPGDSSRRDLDWFPDLEVMYDPPFSSGHVFTHHPEKATDRRIARSLRFFFYPFLEWYWFRVPICSNPIFEDISGIRYLEISVWYLLFATLVLILLNNHHRSDWLGEPWWSLPCYKALRDTIAFCHGNFTSTPWHQSTKVAGFFWVSMIPNIKFMSKSKGFAK